MLSCWPQVNAYEVQMVDRMVTYFLQQGYLPGQLVVLTPYLGQLMEVHRLLSERRGVGAQLDSADMAQVGKDPLPQQHHHTELVTCLWAQGYRYARDRQAYVVHADVVHANTVGTVSTVTVRVHPAQAQSAVA